MNFTDYHSPNACSSSNLLGVNLLPVKFEKPFNFLIADFNRHYRTKGVLERLQIVHQKVVSQAL